MSSQKFVTVVVAVVALAGLSSANLFRKKEPRVITQYVPMQGGYEPYGAYEQHHGNHHLGHHYGGHHVNQQHSGHGGHGGSSAAAASAAGGSASASAAAASAAPSEHHYEEPVYYQEPVAHYAPSYVQPMVQQPSSCIAPCYGGLVQNAQINMAAAQKRSLKDRLRHRNRNQAGQSPMILQQQHYGAGQPAYY